MPPRKCDPRHRDSGAGVEVKSGRDDRHERTGTVSHSRGRFVPAHGFTATEVETALAVADARQLVRALDRHPDRPSPAACDCPSCGKLRTVVALGQWHVTCEACGMLASWIALRQPCALSVECCLRLAATVHGIRSEVAA